MEDEDEKQLLQEETTRLLGDGEAGEEEVIPKLLTVGAAHGADAAASGGPPSAAVSRKGGSAKNKTNEPARPGAMLPALTGVRGIAAMWIVMYHFGGVVTSYTFESSLQSTPAWLRRAMARAPSAVTLFFILSGFVHVWTRRDVVDDVLEEDGDDLLTGGESGTGGGVFAKPTAPVAIPVRDVATASPVRPSTVLPPIHRRYSIAVVWEFVKKRALRLAPLYYLSLLLWAPFLVVMWSEPQFPATVDATTKIVALVLTPLGLQAWDPIHAAWMQWLPPAWAVSTEVAMYAYFLPLHDVLREAFLKLSGIDTAFARARTRRAAARAARRGVGVEAAQTPGVDVGIAAERVHIAATTWPVSAAILLVIFLALMQIGVIGFGEYALRVTGLVDRVAVRKSILYVFPLTRGFEFAAGIVVGELYTRHSVALRRALGSRPAVLDAVTDLCTVAIASLTILPKAPDLSSTESYADDSLDDIDGPATLSLDFGSGGDDSSGVFRRALSASRAPLDQFTRTFARVWWPFEWWLWATLLVLTSLWVILLADSKRSLTARLCSARAAVRLGEMSYPIYLLQYHAIFGYLWLRSNALTWEGYEGIHSVEFLSVVVLVFAFAHGAAVLVDQPAQRWIKQATLARLVRAGSAASDGGAAKAVIVGKPPAASTSTL